MGLNDIVQINISRQTKAVSIKSFGTIAIISEFASGKTTDTFDRYKFYSSITEMSSDGWETTNNVYKMANIIFSQSPTVTKILVGRRKTSGETTESWTDALNAIQLQTDDWYGITLDSSLAADIEEVAAWTETQKKVYVALSADAAVITSATNDVASVLKGLKYDRTALAFHKTGVSDGSYLDAGWLGEGFPYDPGVSTWAYKTVKGVASYALTTTEQNYAFNKNANTYTNVGGVDVTQEGKVASGEWIDVIIGIDWIEAKIQESIYSNLVNLRKIPYTNEGVQLIVGLVRAVLEKAANQGILIKESIVITAPKVADISSADKLARLLPDVKFTANLQGAIHKVKIDGIVSV